MEQSAWIRPNGASEMQYAVRASSRDRFWTGFDAGIYDTSGGLVQVPPSADHHISMHIGAEVKATCRVDGRLHRRTQTRGDIDIVPRTFSAAWEDDGPTTVLAINVSPALVRSVAVDLGLRQDGVDLAPQRQLRDPKIEHIGWALVAELESPEPYGRLYADSLGVSLVAHLLERYAPMTPVRPTRGLTKRQLDTIVAYVHENLTHELTLAELAAIVGVGVSHFKTLFKQTTGMPVHRYVIQCRVEYAVRLILGGNGRLSDVAVRAGFFDQSHMARSMRRVLGLTPTDVVRSTLA